MQNGQRMTSKKKSIRKHRIRLLSYRSRGTLMSYTDHSCQVRVLYATLGFFFCKVAGKNPWSRVAVFWAYLKKDGCLLGKSDKRLRFFMYAMFAIFSNALIDTLSARS